MPKNWHFIAATGEGKLKDKGSREVVRRTVMQEFRRNERLERINQLQAEAAAEQRARRGQDVHGGRDESCFEYDGAVAAQRDTDLLYQWRATLVDIGPAAVFDPFVSTTLYSNKSHIRLFTRFVYRVAVHIQPLGGDVTKNPFSVVFARNALADPLILSALLYHASVHQDSRSPETLQLETETARRLSERLLEPKETASDSVIATVAFLAATGNITGNVSRELPHWNAMRQLVKLRGGLQSLGWDGALAMMLSVGDIISATITFSKPRLPCPHFPDGLVRDPLHIMPFSPVVPHYRDLPAQIQHVTMLIKSISDLAEQILTPGNVLKASMASIIAYTNVISAIEHRLLSIDDSDNIPKYELPLLYTIRCGKAAALVAATYYFRNMTTTSATIRSLRRRLVAALEDLEGIQPDMLDMGSLKLLLWSSWMGCLTAEDQDWFVVRIHHYMICMNLYCWEDVEDCLQGFILASKRHSSAKFSLDELVMSQSVQLV